MKIEMAKPQVQINEETQLVTNSKEDVCDLSPSVCVQPPFLNV